MIGFKPKTYETFTIVIDNPEKTQKLHNKQNFGHNKDLKY